MGESETENYYKREEKRCGSHPRCAISLKREGGGGGVFLSDRECDCEKKENKLPKGNGKTGVVRKDGFIIAREKEAFLLSKRKRNMTRSVFLDIWTPLREKSFFFPLTSWARKINVPPTPSNQIETRGGLYVASKRKGKKIRTRTGVEAASQVKRT